MDLKTLILLSCFGNVAHDKAEQYAAIILEASKRYNQPATRILSVIIRESRCIETAENNTTGASGLMQLMETSATDMVLGTRVSKKITLSKHAIKDPILNIKLGTRILDKYIRKCKSVELGLNAYNKGSCIADNSYAKEIFTIEAKLQQKQGIQDVRR